MDDSTYWWSYYPDFSSFVRSGFHHFNYKAFIVSSSTDFSSNIATAFADAHEAICLDNKVYTQQRHISSKSHLSLVLQHDSPAT